ncbi:extracellular calcium-sensing receptor-like [Actinia tenebrosa]|uniref:Extracellular calcium-sensing receptor-like n=1 Tax=Actinia tenebrosa TaxID=6105 RepID=A0A6P8H8U2_ACTTE|nr:extracellular calcium-sensing receptor-like [Actinia tenebrosa]
MSYKSGQFIIGVLLPLTKGEDCATVSHESVQLVETIIYGIQKLNINQKHHLNLTIGYEMRDTCSNPKVAVKEASNLVFKKQNDSSCVGEARCECGNEIFAVLGPLILENIILSAGTLSFYQYPQVMLTGKTRLLSNKAMYSLLNSIAPSLTDTAEALSLLIESFGWTSVNIIGSNDVYGREMTTLLDQNLRAKNICISTQRILGMTAPAPTRETISLIRSKHQVRVTVLLTTSDTAIKVLEEARKQNLTAHVWIGTEAWMTNRSITREYSDILDGMLGTAYSGNGLGISSHLRQGLRKTSYSDWIKQFYPSKTISSCETNSKLIDVEGFSPGIMSNALKVLNAIANALENVVYRPENTRNNKDFSNVNVTRIRNEIKRVLPNIIVKDTETLELQIINLQRQLSGEIIFESVGRWSKNHSQEGRLFLQKEKIRWPGNYKHWVPFSGNIEPCYPGYYIKKGPIACIWECLRCPIGTYTDNYTSPVCKQCPDGKIPDSLQTRCVVSEQEYLKAIDPFGISILCACAVGMIVTGAVLAIFLKYQDTPVVRASNMGFCLFTLVLLLLWFLSPVLFLGRPKDWTCKVRTVCIPLLYTSVSALLLTKTKRLIRIFSALKRNRFLSNYWYSFVACSIVLVQIVFGAIYLIFFPPETLIIYQQEGKVSLHCTRNLALEIASFSYNCLLAILCASFAMKSRNLPETYSEAKYICFTMLTYMISWIIYFLGYYGITYGNLKTAIPSYGVIIGAFAVLFFIFIPKIRVIFFRPEKNTKMAALAGTRKYSIDVASGMNITIPKPSRACERRHTLATLPAYHETDLPFASSTNYKGEPNVPRFSSSCLVGPIKEVDLEEESTHAQDEVNVSTNFALKKDVNLNICPTNEVPNGIALASLKTAHQLQETLDQKVP